MQGSKMKVAIIFAMIVVVCVASEVSVSQKIDTSQSQSLNLLNKNSGSIQNLPKWIIPTAKKIKETQTTSGKRDEVLEAKIKKLAALIKQKGKCGKPKISTKAPKINFNKGENNQIGQTNFKEPFAHDGNKLGGESTYESSKYNTPLVMTAKPRIPTILIDLVNDP